MKFTIERTHFLKTLSHIQSIVEKRNTIPALSNVRIEAKNSFIDFKATDMDIEITEIVDASVSENGAITAPAHMLYDIVRKLPDGSDIEITYPDAKGALCIASGRSKFSLSTIAVEDFPVVSDDVLPINFEINKDELKTLIDRTQFSASIEEARYYLNGLYVHAKNEGETKVLRVVATDGHRLACAESPLPNGAEKLEGVIIPRKSVLEIRKLLDDASIENIKISLSENKIKISLDNITLFSKLLDGTFPDYERVIPTDNNKILEVNVKELATAVDRISVVTERTRGIRLTASTNHVTITATNAELGNAVEELEATYDKETIDTGYNFRYLLDILAQIKGEEVRLSLSSNSAATVINDTSDNSAIYVLMPMRI